MRICQLTVQDLAEPLGIGTQNPRFGYILEDEEKDQLQTAYQLLAATSPMNLEIGKADLWDSGKVKKSETFGIVYEGKKLCSGQKAYWKVMSWDKNDAASLWSEVSFWEMGLLNENDWKGKWIGQGDEYQGNKAAAPMFACDFQAGELINLLSARLYISGLGIYTAYLNGKRIADTYFDPGESDASSTAYYVTYDLNDLLWPTKNTLGVMLGNGQYTNFLINPVMTDADGKERPEHRYQKNDAAYVKKGIYGEKKFLAQIVLSFADDTQKIVAMTDETWKWTDGPVVFQNWYGGEDYDATKEIEDWCLPQCSRNNWMHTVVMEPPGGIQKAREYMPIVITDRYFPKDIKRLSNGNWLVDMGLNAAGFPELSIEADIDMRGRLIKMYPAEMIKENGEGISQASCTQSWNERYHCQIMDSYRMKGKGREVWHPNFCYHGFQYLEIEGYPGTLEKENIQFCIVRTKNDKNGSFTSSDPLMNQIGDMIEISMESNMMSAFTDCPHIEKLGWIETSHLMFRSLASTYDIRSWMRKIIKDIADSQIDEKSEDSEEAGFIPGIVPEYQRIGGLYRDPNWNGACVFTPWEYYQYYGEKDILEAGYPVMKNYVAYLQAHLTDGILDNYAHMGEWGEYGETTPTVLVATCAYYRLLRCMAAIADILGLHEDSERYTRSSVVTFQAFHDNNSCYTKESQTYGSGSQASYGCVLFSGMYYKEEESLILEKLINAIKEKNYHLTSGEVGLKQVLCVLGEHTRSDVAYKMIMNTTSPSYRYFAEKGLTALPEYWNCDELWHGMERSRNHAMMGHAKEWMIFYLLGIRSEKAGFQKISIQSYIPQNMTMLCGALVCSYGKISVECKITGKMILLKAEIPVGVQAVVYRPVLGDNDSGNLTKQEPICEVGSGLYQWVLQ